MRVMVLVKATDDSEKGILPTPEMWEAMHRFNEELIEAGIRLAADGLKPSAHGSGRRGSGRRREGSVALPPSVARVRSWIP